MATITLPNSIVLDPDNAQAVSLLGYAASKGLTDVRIFHARDPQGHEEYLIAVGTEPEFSSQSFEAIAVHLDIMALARQADRT